MDEAEAMDDRVEVQALLVAIRAPNLEKLLGESGSHWGYAICDPAASAVPKRSRRSSRLAKEAAPASRFCAREVIVAARAEVSAEEAEGIQGVFVVQPAGVPICHTLRDLVELGDEEAAGPATLISSSRASARSRARMVSSL